MGNYVEDVEDSMDIAANGAVVAEAVIAEP